MRSSPRLVIIAGITVAIGVAAPTVMFSIVHGFLRDLPFAEGHRLVYVTRAERIGAARDVGLTPRELREWHATQRSLEALAGFSVAPMTVGGGEGAAERYSGARMSASGFRALRVAPRLGTTYGVREEESGEDVVVISDRLWRARFGASAAAVGSSVRLNGRPTRVLGVMPAGFHFPFNEDLWTPLGAAAPGSADDTLRSLHGFGRLGPGVGLDRARAEFALLGERTGASAAADLATRAVSFKESQIEPSDVVLFRAMLVVVMFVLVVACANVGNLLLVRATARVPMFAVKRALGASPATVVREIMAESAVIAFVGGLGGAGFDAFRLRPVVGRLLSAGDTRASTAVAVVNRSFADAHLAGVDPIGVRIRLGALGDSAWLTVVGVVADAGTISRAKGASEVVYASVQQFAPTHLFVSARAADNSAAALQRLAQHLRGVGPDIPVQDVRRLDQALSDARAIPRMFAVLFASFGVAALVLAVVGLYGVVAFAVRQRARELSIRNALGAPPLRLAAAAAGRTGAQLAAGLAVGAGLAVLITPSLMDILFGVDPHDAGVHAAAACSVLVAAVTAVAAPLARAVRMPPAAALRLG